MKSADFGSCLDLWTQWDMSGSERRGSRGLVWTHSGDMCCSASVPRRFLHLARKKRVRPQSLWQEAPRNIRPAGPKHGVVSSITDCTIDKDAPSARSCSISRCARHPHAWTWQRWRRTQSIPESVPRGIVETVLYNGWIPAQFYEIACKNVLTESTLHPKPARYAGPCCAAERTRMV